LCWKSHSLSIPHLNYPLSSTFLLHLLHCLLILYSPFLLPTINRISIIFFSLISSLSSSSCVDPVKAIVHVMKVFGGETWKEEEREREEEEIGDEEEGVGGEGEDGEGGEVEVGKGKRKEGRGEREGERRRKRG
jgi:hypothetical protein